MKKAGTRLIRSLLISAIVFLTVLLVCSCSRNESPYSEYDKEGYTVSVRFDANGGAFTTGVTTVVDAYKPSLYTTTSDGKKEIYILNPADEIRGDQKYTARNAELLLAGWYKERHEVKDADGNVLKNDDGSIKYTYSGLYDFSKPLVIDADGSYSAENPVITLYAAWVPSFTYEFYIPDGNGGWTLADTKKTNPVSSLEIRMPTKNSDGRLYVGGDFPDLDLLDTMSYSGIYLDEALTEPVTGDTLRHTGVFNRETAEYSGASTKIYCTFKEGLWYEVSSLKDFKNAFKKGNVHIILTNDIDFGNSRWNDLSMREFNGEITSSEGECYSIKNLTVTTPTSGFGQSEKGFGIFGTLGTDAVIKNVIFDGITVNVMRGSRFPGFTLGILAGTIKNGADISGVEIKNSRLVFSSDKDALDIASSTTVYGMVCGNGSVNGITFSENNNIEFSNFDGKDNPPEVEFNTPTPDYEGRFQLSKKNAGE